MTIKIMKRPSEKSLVFKTAVVIAFVFSFILQFKTATFASEQTIWGEKKLEEPVSVSGVVYLNQNEKGRSLWCVIYSTTMFLSHYGVKEKPDNIAHSLDMPTRDDAYFSLLSTFASKGSVEDLLQKRYKLVTKKKIFVKLHNYTGQWIRQQLKEDRPVLAIYNRIYGHAILLVGYDNDYLYINDPSGAFFKASSQLLKRNTYPTVWLKQSRSSPFEGAGVRWEDFREFIEKENYLGYLITAIGFSPDAGSPQQKEANDN